MASLPDLDDPRIVAFRDPVTGKWYDSRDPGEYLGECEVTRCSRPATWADDFSRFCEVHEPWPVEAVNAD